MGTSTEAASEWDSLTREQREVLDWRIAQLTEAGIISPYAETLAGASHVDIHQAAKLKAAGATPEQILAILL